MCPRTTACNHWPSSGMGSCLRRCSSAFTSFSFACNLLRIVCRNTVNRPLLLFFTQMCVKPRKLNVCGFPSPRHSRWSIAKGPNSRSRVFSGCSSKVELLHSFRKFRPELFGIRFAVKAHHDVVRESHHDHIAVCALLTPCLDPQIEYVMKIDVRQKRRGTSALGRPLFYAYSFPILQHAGPQ